VREDQRARILEATERLICERGVDRVSVNALTASARVSRSTFYRAFADREDVLLAVFDVLTDRLATEMLGAYAAEDRWVDGVRAGLVVVLDFLQLSPHRARFLIAGGLTGGSPMLARRRRLLAELARAFDAHRPRPPGDALPAPFGAEALIGAAVAIIHARLFEDPVPDLRELCGSLMAVMVMPSLGGAGAREELVRSPAGA
jgi:AcrR family transcriptional regulator